MTAKTILKFITQVFIFFLVGFVIITAVDIYRLKTQAVQTIPDNILQLIEQHLPETDNNRNQALVIYAWGTWCPICQFTSPSFSRLSESRPVISIAMKSGDATTVARYQKQHQLQFPTIIDPYNHLAQQLSIKGTPSFFIINRQGRILYYSMGASSAIGLRLKLFIIENLI